jgi:hypothetical protein
MLGGYAIVSSTYFPRFELLHRGALKKLAAAVLHLRLVVRDDFQKRRARAVQVDSAARGRRRTNPEDQPPGKIGTPASAGSWPGGAAGAAPGGPESPAPVTKGAAGGGAGFSPDAVAGGVVPGNGRGTLGDWPAQRERRRRQTEPSPPVTNPRVIRTM